MAGANQPRIHLAPSGFVYIEGVRVFRYIPDTRELQFMDKDGRRSAERGECFVYLRLDELSFLALEIERQSGVIGDGQR